MTLVITIFTAEGIYQSSDHRLTYHDGRVVQYEAMKQAHLSYLEGRALVCFAGRAETARRTALMQWMRESLAREPAPQTFDAALLRLESDANDALSHPRVPLIIGVAGFTASDFFWHGVTNYFPDASGTYRLQRRFAVWKQRLSHVGVDGRRYMKPSLRIGGSGARFISKADKALMLRVAGRRPRHPTDYMNLLATVNVRTALRAGRIGVEPDFSAWCHVMRLDKASGHVIGAFKVPRGMEIGADYVHPPIIFQGRDVTGPLESDLRSELARPATGLSWHMSPKGMEGEVDAISNRLQTSTDVFARAWRSSGRVGPQPDWTRLGF